MDGTIRAQDPRVAHGSGVEVGVPHHLDADPDAELLRQHGTDTEVVVPLHDDDWGHALGDLRRRMTAALERGPSTLVIDVSGVTRLSSTGIALLLWVRRRSAARGVRVVLREPSRPNVDLLRRTGLLGALAIEGLETTPWRGDSPAVRGPS